MLHIIARAMYLGFTRTGMPIEVGTVDDAHDGEVIIHAMTMRKTLRDELRRQGG